jgi:hypothetical protein
MTEINCNSCLLFNLFLFEEMSVNVEQWVNTLKQEHENDFDTITNKITELILKYETDLVFLYKSREEQKLAKESQYYKNLRKEAEEMNRRKIEEHKAFLDSR